MTPHLILVGGFLGAGKTTLLLATGSRLRATGKRVGIILNDQGGELVDTRLAENAGFTAQEITGGCFCCRFSEFVRAAENFDLNAAPDVILAEPVGSCTDLAATIMQPVRRYYGDKFRLAPLTVLVDPARAKALMSPDSDPLLSYLFRKQIAEADVVCSSKSDLYQHPLSIYGRHIRRLSARTGAGIPEWLDDVLSWNGSPGEKLLDIDYARYAEAEASLGWLNWHGELRLVSPRTPAALIGPLLSAIDRMLTGADISIAHLKLFARSKHGFVHASICRNGDRPFIGGQLDAPPNRRCSLTINLRAVGAPAQLRAIVDRCISELPGRLHVDHAEAFRPSPPVPEHRFQEAV